MTPLQRSADRYAAEWRKSLQGTHAPIADLVYDAVAMAYADGFRSAVEVVRTAHAFMERADAAASESGAPKP